MIVTHGNGLRVSQSTLQLIGQLIDSHGVPQNGF
jgi:hypothetical protein